MRIAIIGAGMSGLACADLLQNAGHAVTLFDKARGPGGRMSTRRLQTALGEVSIDHGAQYFTARDPEFRDLARHWHSLGIAAPWPEAAADGWVGTPGMSAVIRQMASAQQVNWGTLVVAANRISGHWQLVCAEGAAGPFDAVIVAVPAEQAAPIISLHDLAMAQSALMARSQPCWAGMFVFESPLQGVPTIIRDRGPVAWASRNNAKPGRSGPEAWIVQASAAWSASRIDCSRDEVAAMLLAALGDAAGRTIAAPVAAVAHRWRFALSSGTGIGALWNAGINLGLCGDWLLGPRVECAWMSGRILAGKILQKIPRSADCLS